MEQKSFKIEIKETLSRVVEVKASSLDEAFNKVQSKYHDESIILDSNDFTDVEFKVFEP